MTTRVFPQMADPQEKQTQPISGENKEFLRDNSITHSCIQLLLLQILTKVSSVAFKTFPEYYTPDKMSLNHLAGSTVTPGTLATFTSELPLGSQNVLWQPAERTPAPASPWWGPLEFRYCPQKPLCHS